MVEEKLKAEVAKKIAAHLSMLGRRSAADIRYLRRISAWGEEPFEELSFKGIASFLQRAFQRAGIPKGELALYLGPLRKDLAREVEKTGWFSKILYLDASREQLEPFGNIEDPYRLGRMRFDIKKNLYDEYERGVWHILTRKSGISDIVTYEFTPFLLGTPGFQLSLLKALANSDRFVFMAHDPIFQMVVDAFQMIGKEPHLDVKVYKVGGRYVRPEKGSNLLRRVPVVRVAVIKPSDTLKKAAQAVIQVFHTTPVHPKRGVTVNYVKEHLDRLLRLKAQNREEYEEMWKILHHIFSVDPFTEWIRSRQKT